MSGVLVFSNVKTIKKYCCFTDFRKPLKKRTSKSQPSKTTRDTTKLKKKEYKFQIFLKYIANINCSLIRSRPRNQYDRNTIKIINPLISIKVPRGVGPRITGGDGKLLNC